VILFPINSIDKSLYQEKDIYLTEPKKFESTEKIFDDQILKLNKKIESLIKILDTLKITRMPPQILYIKEPEYYEIITFLKTDSHSYLSLVQIKTIQMNFSNNKFSKLQVILSKQNFQSVLSINDIILDTDPSKLNKDHIKIISKFLDSVNRTSIGDFENNAIYPLRIYVKKDFIIPTLQYIILNLQLIHKYNFEQKINKEKDIIDRIKQSNQY
jgi:hypothetical protein